MELIKVKEYVKYTDGLKLIQNRRQMAGYDSSLLGRHSMSLDEQSFSSDC
jgi:hypothetical protein